MILVTGFVPFLTHPVNPTELLILDLQRSGVFAGEVETMILPVSFEEAFDLLKKQILNFRNKNNQDYSVILLLGLASGRRKISIERVGLNWCESENPDNNGFCPVRGPIDNQKSPAFFTSLKPESLVSELGLHSIPAEVSLSAGGYVCNYVYFKTLSEINIPALFIHVPDLALSDEESMKRPTLDFAIMQKALSQIITQLK